MNQLFCRECIANAPFTEYFMWSTGLVLATLYSLYLSYRSFKKARLIKDMPRSLIRSASQGFTELVGVAKIHDQALFGPLTNNPCLWWKYSIEKYQRSGKSSSWRTIESGTSKKPFYIDDNSGLCLVLHEGADLSAGHKRQWRGSLRRPLSATGTQEKANNAAQSTTRKVLDMLSTDIGFGSRYRYTEYLIKDSDPLYILGSFRSDASGQRTLSIEKIAGDILRSWKQDFAQLLSQYDRNNDGQLDAAEWKIVTNAAKKAAHKQQGLNAKQPPEHQIGKPVDSGLPFLISSEEQDVLSKRYRLKALACSAAFLAIGSTATWYISAWN